MQITISTIALVFSSIALAFGIFYLGKSKSHKNLTSYCQIMFVLLFIWDFSLLCQNLFANILNIKPIYFDYIAYIGITFLPVDLYFLSQTIRNKNFKIKRLHLLLFVIPIISMFVLWTSDYHNLFYQQYSIMFSSTVYGIYFYIYVLYTYVLVVISLINLLKYSIQTKHQLSIQSFLLLLAIAIPVLVNVIGLLHIYNLTIYATPISFTTSSILIFIAIFKFDFLNIKTIANNLIIDTLSDPYVVIDKENIVVTCGKSFFTTFKVKKDEILEENLSSISLFNKFSKNFKDDLEVSIELVKNNKEKITIEKFFEKFNKFFMIDISPILKNKSYVGTLIFFKDITQEEHDKQRIKADQELLIEQERFASLGQMIGGISHNLKTPIFSIAGGLEGLSDLVQEFDESIDDPNVTSEDMHGIANDMNDWICKMKDHNSYMSNVITAVRGQTVAMSSLENERFTIKELFDEVLILMQHELKKQLATLTITNNVPYNSYIMGNINSLVQVINNLISNAIEAYENTKKEKIINLTANFDESQKLIYITVQDFGPGLPASIQNKLFKEMITTKGKYGTGLGLFMSYSNIKAHFKGDLTFETKANVGTTFTISIPCK